jgi:hypothetical protein
VLSRRFGVVGDPSRAVVLTISLPRRWHRDWACWIRIDGIPNGRAFAPGVDPLQAVQLAITKARTMLDASGLPLQWLEGEPGDVGIPMPVPSIYGWKTQRTWERTLEWQSRRIDRATAAIIELKLCGRAIRKRLEGAASVLLRWVRRR